MPVVSGTSQQNRPIGVTAVILLLVGRLRYTCPLSPLFL